MVISPILLEMQDFLNLALHFLACMHDYVMQISAEQFSIKKVTLLIIKQDVSGGLPNQRDQKELLISE